MTKPEMILAGLGGAQNIDDLESCITRLRVEVNDPNLVDEVALKDAGAYGVVRVDSTVQVVIGPESDQVADEVNALR